MNVWDEDYDQHIDQAKINISEYVADGKRVVPTMTQIAIAQVHTGLAIAAAIRELVVAMREQP